MYLCVYSQCVQHVFIFLRPSGEYFSNNTLESNFCILSGAAVTLTDLPVALPQLQANVSANMPSSGWPSHPPAVLPLSWGEDHMKFPSDWDLVLCADIIYLPETYPLLVETLTHLCKNGAVAYLSSKMRKEHGTPGFYEDCLPSRFNVELVHRDDKQNMNIYRASLRTDQWRQGQLSTGLGLRFVTVVTPVMALVSWVPFERILKKLISKWKQWMHSVKQICQKEKINCCCTIKVQRFRWYSLSLLLVCVLSCMQQFVMLNLFTPSEFSLERKDQRIIFLSCPLVLFYLYIYMGITKSTIIYLTYM